MSNDKKPSKDSPASGDRPAIMNWVILIIGLLVVAQAVALGLFWLKL